jgi:hypothetical protein
VGVEVIKEGSKKRLGGVTVAVRSEFSVASGEGTGCVTVDVGEGKAVSVEITGVSLERGGDEFASGFDTPRLQALSRNIVIAMKSKERKYFLVCMASSILKKYARYDSYVMKNYSIKKTGLTQRQACF